MKCESQDLREYVSNPTRENILAAINYINSVLKNGDENSFQKAFNLAIGLIKIEDILPTPPHTIDKVLLSLAERSHSCTDKIMNVIKDRIPKIKKSISRESCEVILTYSVLNKCWDSSCEDRIKLVDTKFKNKIMKKLLDSRIIKDTALDIEYDFDVSFLEFKNVFCTDYFKDENYWNPLSPSKLGFDKPDLLASGLIETILYIDEFIQKHQRYIEHQNKMYTHSSRSDLLQKYKDRSFIAIEKPSDRSFVMHFIFSYSLICSSKYEKAKHHLKKLLIYLKENKKHIESTIKLEFETNLLRNQCHKSILSEQGISKLKLLSNDSPYNLEHSQAENGLFLLKAHIYNLISFCHLYLGEYSETCYYLENLIDQYQLDAFKRRKSLINFMIGHKEMTDLDLWIHELEFMGGSYERIHSTSKVLSPKTIFEDNATLFKFLLNLVETRVNLSSVLRCLETPKSCFSHEDLGFLVLTAAGLFERKLVLNILLRNSKTILREIMFENNIHFIEECISLIKSGSSSSYTNLLHKSSSRKSTSKHKAKGYFYEFFICMIPPNSKVFSFYLIKEDLFINDYLCNSIAVINEFSKTLAEMEQILKKSKETLKLNVSSREEIKKWWEVRYGLDNDLGKLIKLLKLDISVDDTNFLLVSTDTQNFPFEYTKVFLDKIVFRIPCISFLRKTLPDNLSAGSGQGVSDDRNTILEHAFFKNKSNTHLKVAEISHSSRCLCNICQIKNKIPKLYEKQLPKLRHMGQKDVFYLLDPMNNLKKSQMRLRPLLSKYNGILGRVPSSKELEIAKNMPTLLYFGHGNGYRYFNTFNNKNMALFGCSSARTLNYPNFKRQGAIYKYLERCSFLIGCLWDVTDRDLDEISKTIIKEGVVRRSVCRLKYLNGSAVVVYGYL